MDIPRGSSIALPLPSIVFHSERRRRLSRSSSQTSSDCDPPTASMSIPGSRVDDVPPPLPPPRYNHDLDQGLDIAWSCQNEHSSLVPSRLAPIKPGSSLLGGQSHALLVRDEDEDIDMDLDIESAPTSAPPTHPPPHSSLATRIRMPSLSTRPPSSSGINQRLHGENPLAQQNHNQTIHAYDKHILQKIGKSNSPPSHPKSILRRHAPLGEKLSIQTRGPNLLLRPAQDPSSSTDFATKWTASPTSAVSPTSRPGWHDYSMNPISPSSETTSNSYSLDPELFLTANAKKLASRTRLGSTRSTSDAGRRSEQEILTSNSYTGDADSTGDEGSFGSLHGYEKPRSMQRHGTKRRALSPPQAEVDERRTERPPLRLQSMSGVQSVTPLQPYKAGSLSSTASSTYPNSYASSYLLSNASSVTSVSSQDKSLSRLAAPYTSLESPAYPGHSPTLAALPLRKTSESSATSGGRMSSQTTISDVRATPSWIGNHFICSCCPKKPKKFENEEQLRAHENEKQYTCAYCTNRFKNKNEAERHQNSLHLRKQSWSCAAISTYQAAFHPSALSNPRNLASDTCGFCGEEFTNQPPNWEVRVEHLTNVHKFGECNSTKKFYRADHFRQHLKHSHAGKSGKWTNILENSCQREEAPSEPASLSPTASEHSQSGSTSRLQGFPNPMDAAIGSVGTIDEVHEES